MKKILLISSLLALISCNLVNPDKLVASDTISYQVFGSNISGVAAITYSTPTSIIQLNNALTVPFQTGAIAGYGQFVNQKPAITVLVYGCATAEILINAKVVVTKTACGQPATVTVSH